ncbi:unnamed protein product [Schistocephalus solidus]|uniref:C2H2-type domain-containing protein n=1 Tax=Schistocephalus solidus TaxID=70667 RepID=A0A183TEB4_SCHSO|nr:unnamed protein product [Schistocephalus solidus]
MRFQLLFDIKEGVLRVTVGCRWHGHLLGLLGSNDLEAANDRLQLGKGQSAYDISSWQISADSGTLTILSPPQMQRHHLPSYTLCTNHDDEHHLPHSHQLSSHHRLTAICYLIRPQYQRWDSVLTCPQCDHTFTSHIGLVGHLQIHRTETDELVSKAPTHSIDRHLQCRHCLRAFTHRMGLRDRMRFHECGTHHDANTSCAPINTPHNPPMISINNTSSRTPADSEPLDLSCSPCHHTCISRIGLVGHLRIHRTETGEPVPGAPIYPHRTQPICPHCPRIFAQRMVVYVTCVSTKTSGRTPLATPQH